LTGGGGGGGAALHASGARNLHQFVPFAWAGRDHLAARSGAECKTGGSLGLEGSKDRPQTSAPMEQTRALCPLQADNGTRKLAHPPKK